MDRGSCLDQLRSGCTTDKIEEIVVFMVLGVTSWLGAADQLETDVAAIRDITKAWQEASHKGDGEAMEERGKIIVIYQRQPDGSWKIAREIWNRNHSVPKVD